MKTTVHMAIRDLMITYVTAFIIGLVEAKVLFTRFLLAVTCPLLNEVVDEKVSVFRQAFGNEKISQDRSEPRRLCPTGGLCHAVVCSKVACSCLLLCH